jgi:tRNA G10  N-methylase Trm11
MGDDAESSGVEPARLARGVTLYCGDCLDVLKTLPAASIDSVVCDPPYGLQFRLGELGERDERCVIGMGRLPPASILVRFNKKLVFGLRLPQHRELIQQITHFQARPI